MVAIRWGVQRQMCLVYNQAWWWECHGLGLHECCRHWGATVHWRNHECQHVLHVTYWNRAWSSPFRDRATGKYSNMITTTALLKKLKVKVMDRPSMSPDLNPIEHLWGILKWKVSNIHQLCDVVMEEWKWTPVVTCEALVNSMPKRVGHTIMVAIQNIDTLCVLCVLTFVASGLDINGCVWSYFEGTAHLHCYTSCTLTTLHCNKVSFLQCCHTKIYNTIFKKGGVKLLLWDTVYIYIYIYIYI